MEQSSTLSPELASYLEIENLTWYEVWKPLKKAANNNTSIICEGNIMVFGYEPQGNVYTVATVFGDVPDASLSEREFIREVGKYTRGAPSC